MSLIKLVLETPMIFHLPVEKKWQNEILAMYTTLTLTLNLT